MKLSLAHLLLVLLALASVHATPITPAAAKAKAAQDATEAEIRAKVPMTPEMETLLAKWKDAKLPDDATASNTTASAPPASIAGSRPSRPAVADTTRTDLRIFARFAAASYCIIHDNLRKWTCGANCQGGTEGTRDVTVINTSKYQLKGWMGVNDRLQMIIVSFRGTLEPMNFIQDLKLNQVSASARIPTLPSGAKFHAGFWDTYNDGRELIRGWLKERVAKYPGYKVHFTGHSLGAALSIIAALDQQYLQALPSSRIRVLNFGEPRVGNPTFAAYVSNNLAVTRYVHEDDVIPHVPRPDWAPTGYAHHTSEVYSYDGTLYDCKKGATASKEDPSCAATRWPTINMVSHLLAMDTVFGPWC
ncbi:hypothetical protein AMAG_14222 [Allomyces macrogynus ATCC 38327]|uniref:Fungal lipase-type domain-containing protein n=1 Tax=Allomyces macrogynus (strain ATCC 38327) TaxID=578462 RepID=A0A0L0T4J8_ALLM3|nr:hypothetical protein AMAG_14222 [Allomyces macrogynus ATCC 38327]|eukprot:KNE69667.1 hypothetical protein AMAG_14222 [Allomyces macrogynus ATCC 38327]